MEIGMLGPWQPVNQNLCRNRNPAGWCWMSFMSQSPGSPVCEKWWNLWGPRTAGVSGTPPLDTTDAVLEVAELLWYATDATAPFMSEAFKHRKSRKQDSKRWLADEENKQKIHEALPEIAPNLCPVCFLDFNRGAGLIASKLLHDLHACVPVVFFLLKSIEEPRANVKRWSEMWCGKTAPSWWRNPVAV